MSFATLTQKEAAAALGVSRRQFIRYRQRFTWLRPVGLTGLVPLFRPDDLERLKREVYESKLASIEALRQARRKPAPAAAKLVSLRELRRIQRAAQKRKAVQ